MRRWWHQISHAHFNHPPLTGPVGHQILANAAVKFSRELLIQRPSDELRLVERRFETKDALGQQRS